MDMSYTPEQTAFRNEVRDWIQSALPPHLKRKADVGASFEHEEVSEWHRILHRKGWICPHWPKEHGGTGWDVTRQFIFSEEIIRAGAPVIPPFAVYMLAPLLIEFGTDEQKKRFLPKIASGDEYWCQGYSEPNAGSDLAALQCRADLDGDHFVLNGQKTWTSHGQYADWIFCLVRTDPQAKKKQEGISFILVDIKNTPGVEVKPFLTLGGLPSFCDTYFENARVPVQNIVGKVGGGWTVAKALLGHERITISGINETARALRMLKDMANTTKVGGQTLMDDVNFRQKLAIYEIKVRAIRMAQYRTLAASQHGKAPGPESSILKLRGTELLQLGYEIAMDVMGYNSFSWFNAEGVVPLQQQWVASQFNYLRAATIYGGSNEIQRNIIAKMILGLPA
jgi:alkylation response protein AidB-like acyl-CoA dehydrogenase